MEKNEKMMRIVICDDEESSLQRVTNVVREAFAANAIQVQLEAISTPEKLLAQIEAAYDVLFLDVDMGAWNGIEVAREIRQYNAKVIIVYISGFIQYSPSGYKVNAFRYLLKSELEETLPECVEDIVAAHYAKPESICIQYKNESTAVELADIIYCESQRALMLFHTAGGGPAFKSYDTMRSLEARLAPKGFLRIQKSFLVNMAHIQKIRNYEALLKDGNALPTSRQGFAQLQQSFLLWKGRL